MLTKILILAALLVAGYVIFRFILGFSRLIMIEEMECDKFHDHHNGRNG